MRDAVRHVPTVAELAVPGKLPTGPMHSPTHRHAQPRYDVGGGGPVSSPLPPLQPQDYPQVRRRTERGSTADPHPGSSSALRAGPPSTPGPAGPGSSPSELAGTA